MVFTELSVIGSGNLSKLLSHPTQSLFAKAKLGLNFLPYSRISLPTNDPALLTEGCIEKLKNILPHVNQTRF